MLTPPQQQALDSTRHLSVTANAGSGKTTVLVERYVQLLLSSAAHVNEIVAITFTEKAASELKRRIADHICQRMHTAHDGHTRARLEALREELSGAIISTIHSFCARILREYPVEADVDAAFTVLDEMDKAGILQRAIREAFETILRGMHPDVRRDDLFELLRTVGKSKALTIVHALATKRDLVERWLSSGGIFEREDKEVLQCWRSTIIDLVERVLSRPTLEEDLETLGSNVVGEQASALRSQLEHFRSADSLAERLQTFYELSQALLTQKGEPRKAVFESATEDVARAAKRVSTLANRVQPYIDFLCKNDDGNHPLLLRYVRLLLRVYQDAERRYAEAKNEGAYLDFDDLQLRVKDLLKNENVRQKLAQRFKYIMVDEYQDTNLLQYEILLPLLAGLSRGNLFIVGDPKQSIFGFRDANVAVFNKTRRDICHISGEESAVTLGESFRMLRNVAAFINVLFSSIMQAEDDPHKIGYEPLVCGRQSAAEGRVELILAQSHTEAALALPSEVELVAKRILQLHQTGYTVLDKRETERPIEFRDVAILLRSRTHLGELEEVLVRHHIPYVVSGGVGYFQTQAVYDFYHYFRFLLNTEDELALVGILRSPFFSVSDAGLFAFRLKTRWIPLWEALCTQNPGGETFEQLARATQMLKQDVAIASRLTAPELIDRIMEQTAYIGFAAGTARSEQLLANIEKLKRVAREYAARGFTTLYDFTARLQRLIEEEEAEGQATVDIKADAVRVMTIHAAKGLEFPVVFVPFLGRGFRSDPEPFLDERLGFAFRPAERKEDMPNVPMVELFKRLAFEKSIAEEKRIFYVACTRAQDLLVLSGTIAQRLPKSYQQWLVDVLGLDAHHLPAQRTFNVRTDCLRLGTNGYEKETIQHPLTVHILRSQEIVADVPLEPRPVHPPQEPRRVMIQRILPKEGGEIFSATKIRTYAECPSKYYLRYIVGLPISTVRLFNDPFDDEGDVEIPRDLRGRAFHYAMQHIDRLYDSRDLLVEEVRRFVRRDSTAVLSEPSLEIESLVERVLGVVRSDFWQKLQCGSEHRAEFTIMTKLGADILLGTMDRVYRGADGVWSVVDFKTDSLAQESIEQKADRYETQLKFYALLVSKYFSAHPLRASLLFSERPEQPVQWLYKQDDLHQFEQEILSTISHIRSGDFQFVGGPCSSCPFLPQGCLWHSGLSAGSLPSRDSA